jgi:lipopolysaccharide export system protein LptC
VSWRTALVLLLLAGALVSGWSAWIQRDEVDEAAAGPVRSGYVLHDFELVTLNAEGRESFSLQAPELRQTPGARTMELTTPLFLMPDQHGSHWEVRSKSGWVNESSDEIRLRGDVVAISPMGATRPTTVNTEELDVFPNQNLATSSVVVTTTSPGTTMRGTGMRVHLADKRVELLSKVSMTHEPTRR